MAQNRSWSQSEEERLSAMVRSGVRLVDIARALNRSGKSVSRKVDSLGIRGESPDISQKVVDQQEDRQRIVWTTSTPVLTQEDALEKAAVDTGVWEVDRCVVNSWEVAMKGADGSARKTPLWQVKLWLSRKKGWNPEELIAQVVSELKQTPRTRSKRSKFPKNGVLSEISILDHHFGKLAWKPESGDNYDVSIASQRYELAADELLHRIESRRPSRILYVLGHDFYHVDKGDNTTTKGTRLDADGRWQKAYVAGLRLCRDTINKALEIAPVSVSVVPGNHDMEKAFTLGINLATIYEGDSRVDVDCSPALKKKFRWGSTLLGMMHGENMTVERLRLLVNEMGHHWPEDFAATRWREWHLGHLHKEQEDCWRYRSTDTVGDVIVRRLPSLSGTDFWHYHNGYRALGAAEAHHYHDKYGRIGYDTVTELAMEL